MSKKRSIRNDGRARFNVCERNVELNAESSEDQRNERNFALHYALLVEHNVAREKSDFSSIKKIEKKVLTFIIFSIIIMIVR